MTFKRSKLKNLFIWVVGAGLVMLYQGCSVTPGFRIVNQFSSSSGGDGIEGMRFLTYGTCVGAPSVAVRNTIVVAKDFSTATMIRQDCSDLSDPVSVDVNSLNFLGARTAGTFQLQGEVYDQQAVSQAQRVTLEVCSSTDGSVQAQVWEIYGAPSSFFGSVNLSGTLNVNAPIGNEPSDFSTGLGQASQFDLDLTNSKLTYAIGGAPSSTVAVTCASQAIPPAPPTGSGLPLDVNRWTVFTPDAATRTIYVSSSTGQDSNDGLTQQTAVKTVAKGVTLLRDGFPDWLLLKQGDVWVDDNFAFCAPGRSASAPAVISTYGNGARPLIKVANVMGFGIGVVQGNGCSGTSKAYLAVNGIELYAYQRDPNSPSFNHSSIDNLITGGLFLNPMGWLLIEDSKFSFFETNIAVESAGADFVGLRRNVITDAYSISYYGPGVYFDQVKSILAEENVLDHNGWNALIAGAGPVDGRTNITITNTCGPANLNGNITTNSSAEGMVLADGSVVTNNLFVRDPVAQTIYVGTTPSSITNNVILEGTDINASLHKAYGIDVFPGSGGPLQISGNIFKQDLSATPETSNGIWITQGASGVAVTNNVGCQWANPILNKGVNNIVAANVLNPTTCDGLGFPDSSVTIESYDSSLGGPGTLDDFVAKARLQSKASWNPAATANSVNSYIRAGF